MNTTDMDNYIGKTAKIKKNGLEILVKIKDAKMSYGHLRFLVCPVQGEGESWVQNLEVLNV